MAMVLRRTQSWTHAHCCIWDNTNFKYFLNILNHEESPNSTCIWMSSLSCLNYHSALCSVVCLFMFCILHTLSTRTCPRKVESSATSCCLHCRNHLRALNRASQTLSCGSDPLVHRKTQRSGLGGGLREEPLTPDTSPWHDSMFRWVLAQGSGYSLDFNMLFTRRQAPRPWWEGWCALSRLLVLWHGHVHMKLALLSVLCHRPSPQLCKQLQSHFSVRPISTSFLKSLILQSFLPLVALTHVSKQIFYFSPRSP